ncbi:hypothetical protein LS66_005755 [Helicobacter sp. MIT 03-1614]|jgi:hypothetical protein|uniref:hypothetical protein n=1 Tax=Helicobacter TaxID=209 RepID=UPI0002F8303C|nr:MULTISPECIES: hypothetical protein [Helicobacter]TLD89024.1 hypothetical protein LS66_005755 [Helicobacter sp. MIT 03-1614]
MALSPDGVFMLISIFFVALFVLISLLYIFGPAPKKPEYQFKEEERKISIEDIMKILDSPKSDLPTLKKAADMFFDNYDKLTLNDYRKKSFLFAITTHARTSTELIMNTEKRLRELNPGLEKDLNKTLHRALDARDIMAT